MAPAQVVLQFLHKGNASLQKFLKDQKQLDFGQNKA
jgi:hypothetical protein